MRASVALTLLSLGCAYLKGEPGYFQHGGSNTNYTFAESGYRTTPGGVRLWDPKHEVQDSAIDAVVSRAETCLASLPVPTEAELNASACYNGPPRWKTPVMRRDYFTIAIAPDWYVSSCTGKQLFPCFIAKADCAQAKKDKGLEGDCPCACRGTVQQNKHVVVTPNLELLPGTLATLLTGCLSPWAEPLNRCTAPP